jgi:hypothetical protein
MTTACGGLVIPLNALLTVTEKLPPAPGRAGKRRDRPVSPSS